MCPFLLPFFFKFYFFAIWSLLFRHLKVYSISSPLLFHSFFFGLFSVLSYSFQRDLCSFFFFFFCFGNLTCCSLDVGVILVLFSVILNPFWLFLRTRALLKGGWKRREHVGMTRLTICHFSHNIATGVITSGHVSSHLDLRSYAVAERVNRGISSREIFILWRMWRTSLQSLYWDDMALVAVTSKCRGEDVWDWPPWSLNLAMSNDVALVIVASDDMPPPPPQKKTGLPFLLFKKIIFPM